MGVWAHRVWRFLFPNDEISDARAAFSFLWVAVAVAGVIWAVATGYWLVAALLAFSFSGEVVMLVRWLRRERDRGRLG